MIFTFILRTTGISCAVFLIIPILFILHSSPAFSQEDIQVSPEAEAALEEELRYLRAETYVITPSRIPEKIKKTAASVSVITDREIRQMGARNLMDVLQTVPGVGYLYSRMGMQFIDIRGGIKAPSIDVLLMVNGHPLNEDFTGGISVHDTLILDNIKRIEVVRSPGSALYGANAVLGVINIITKEAEDIDGFELTTRGGSYDTQQYNLLYGKTFNEVEVAFNFNYLNTHGFNGHVDADQQTFFDQLYGTNASLAPGRMKGDDEKYDAFLTLKYKGFKLDGKYVDRERDFPVGVTAVLNNKNISSWKDYYLNLSYERTLWEGLDLFTKVYRNHFYNRADGQYYPPGSVVFPPFGVAIRPEAAKLRISKENNSTGIEMQTTYKMSDSNTLVAGGTYEEMKLFDWKVAQNIFGTPLFSITLPAVQTLTGPSMKRNFKAFFMEDIWDITDDLRLTAGFRYDDYSDFGSHVSPRAGLTWEFIRGYDLKLLYAHAFRAPSFSESYNPAWGNPDLDPEQVDVYEVSLGAEFTRSLSGRVTLYHRQAKDLIVAVRPYENLGKNRDQGFEVEMKYNFRRGSYLAMNYNYQRWISPHTKWRVWPSPRHTGNIMANIRLSRSLNFYAWCHFEDGVRRQVGDPRDDMSGYALVNATLTAKKFLKKYEGLELQLSAFNLLNKDYTEPTEPLIPNDLPRPGRNFMFELKYRF